MLDNVNSKVEEFIIEQIESVPHLEALLLIWKNHPQKWFVQDMARALYVPPEVAERVLSDLQARDLIVRSPDGSDSYFYHPSEERDGLLKDVDRTYRTQLVRVSSLIHSKASAAVRDFAKAFRFKKD
ncbi:MAG TPA: hypothetical protein VG897_07580 [Terriglobales bacterium]|nr:hypothetical protein [Terriglobales bacterium]